MRSHLLVLNVTHAAIGVKDDDRDMIAIRESLERGLARISARGNGYEVIVGSSSSSPLLLDTRREENGQALQRHILKCACGAMPQLEHVHAICDLLHGADFWCIEIVRVYLAHKLVKLFVIEVDAETLVYFCSTLGVRHVGERDYLIEGQAWQFLRYE